MSTSNVQTDRNIAFDQEGYTQRQKDIINSCIRNEERKNQEENNEGVHTHEIKALVEGTSGIKNNKNDTFITQRGGKMYVTIENHIYIYIYKLYCYIKINKIYNIIIL